MPTSPHLDDFWWRWVGANALAEFVGLGIVALITILVAPRLMTTGDPAYALLYAMLAICLGALEGAVVGWAQSKVLRPFLPAIGGWIRATVFGAVGAWAAGMLPSTLLKISASPNTVQPSKPSLSLLLLLAAGMGAVAGPILAAFQWRSLRRVSNRAFIWLPANAAAWACGMPVIFLGIQVHEHTQSALIITLANALCLLLAGGVVGAVHGRALVWLLSREGSARNAA